MEQNNSVYDICIVGGGPAGLYTALGVIKDFYKNDPECKKKFPYKILIIEKGNPIDQRFCPAIKNKTTCAKCKTCNIMEGMAGAGAFSDGKGKMYLYAIINSNDFYGKSQIKCNSCFEMYGRQFPELKDFKWVDLDEAKSSLSKKLCEAFDKFNVWNTLEEYLGGLAND